MPGVNGLEVGMFLRGGTLADRCTTIAVSAGAQPADLELLHQLGIRHFVAKDRTLKEELAAILREID
jgi:hypothetical protein